MKQQITRRRVVAGIGTVVATGALAGCSTTAGDTSGGDGDGDSVSDGGDVHPEVSSYLSGANGYDGIEDATGDETPTVSVGAGSDGLAFDPAAIGVSTGTILTWEWTGEGGGHNVVEQDGAFRSGDEFVSETGHTYEYTFDEPGTYLYYCEPHQSVDMLGAVVVE